MALASVLSGFRREVLTSRDWLTSRGPWAVGGREC